MEKVWARKPEAIKNVLDNDLKMSDVKLVRSPTMRLGRLESKLIKEERNSKTLFGNSPPNPTKLFERKGTITGLVRFEEPTFTRKDSAIANITSQAAGKRTHLSLQSSPAPNRKENKSAAKRLDLSSLPADFRNKDEVKELFENALKQNSLSELLKIPSCWVRKLVNHTTINSKEYPIDIALEKRNLDMVIYLFESGLSLARCGKSEKEVLALSLSFGNKSVSHVYTDL